MPGDTAAPDLGTLAAPCFLQPLGSAHRVPRDIGAGGTYHAFTWVAST
jgi:hypothetical protein